MVARAERIIAQADAHPVLRAPVAAPLTRRDRVDCCEVTNDVAQGRNIRLVESQRAGPEIAGVKLAGRPPIDVLQDGSLAIVDYRPASRPRRRRSLRYALQLGYWPDRRERRLCRSG